MCVCVVISRSFQLSDNFDVNFPSKLAFSWFFFLVFLMCFLYNDGFLAYGVGRNSLSWKGVSVNLKAEFLFHL